MTRTAGTTAAVTVDVDLSTQPMLPSGHKGYAFARASSGLPATILPAAPTLPMPTGLMATAGDAQVMLALGRAGVGFGRHPPRVPVQDGRELRELDADCEQRAGRDQCVRVHGDGARQRDGPHL